MTPDEYRVMREKLGSQDKASKALDVSVASIVKRENGKQRIRREAEFALRWAVQQEARRPTLERKSIRSVPHRSKR